MRLCANIGEMQWNLMEEVAMFHRHRWKVTIEKKGKLNVVHKSLCTKDINLSEIYFFLGKIKPHETVM